MFVNIFNNYFFHLVVSLSINLLRGCLRDSQLQKKKKREINRESEWR